MSRMKTVLKPRNLNKGMTPQIFTSSKTISKTIRKSTKNTMLTMNAIMLVSTPQKITTMMLHRNST